MASLLSQFCAYMLDNNQRIISNVLDMIAATDGDETLQMNMLATHLDKISLKYMDLKTWPPEDEN